MLTLAAKGLGPSPAAEKRRAGDVIPVVHVSVPVVIVTFLRRSRAAEPAAADGPGARLGI